jgi:hypothetical protein
MDKPVKLYIQDLIFDTVNTVTHLNTINILHKRLNTFRKRVKNVVTSKGIQVGVSVNK